MPGRAATLSRTETRPGTRRSMPFAEFREGVAQPLDQLKYRQVHIGRLAAEQVRPAALFQHGFEVAEIFRRALIEKISRIAFCFRLLVFVVKPRTDWMMRVVDFFHEIRDGQLQLVQP